MTNPPEKLSYFRAMRGCFCGTEVFEQLLGHGMIRVLWHAALTLILLGILTATALFFRFAPVVDNAMTGFREKFGGVVLASRGLYPSFEPEKERYFLPGGGGILLYQPRGVPELPEKTSFADYRFTVVWYPGCLVLIAPAGENRFAVNTCRMKEGVVPEAEMVRGSGGLAAVLKKIAEKEEEKNAEISASGVKKVFVSFEEIGQGVKTVVWGVCFLVFIADALWQTAVFQLIFVGLFVLTGRKERRLQWKDLAKVALYAGCPVLAVAACFVALDLTEFLRFGTVYVIGTIGYFLVIVNKLERSGRTRNP